MVLGDRRLSTDLLVTDIMQTQVKRLIGNCKRSKKQFIDITFNPEVVFNNLKNDPVAVWTLLAYSGYLSLTGRKKSFGSTIIYRARIPNKEVLDIYEDSIAVWIRGKLKLDEKGMNLYEILKNFDLENLEKVKEITYQIISRHSERIGQENESIFHALIEVICLLGGKNHALSAEKKSGAGRIDSIFCPLVGRSNKIIIHEYKIFKKSNKDEDVTAKIQEALWQVYEKKYLDDVVTKFRKYEYYRFYESVEVRAIVILVDETAHNYKMIVDVIRHSMIDSIKILKFFNLITPEQLLKIKAKCTAQQFIEKIKANHNINEIILEFQKKW
jgi:hypothetical protein